MSTINITSDGTYITDYPNAAPVLNRRINFADEKDPYYYKTIWDTMSKDEQLEIVDWLNAVQGVEYINRELAENQILKLQQENKILKHNSEMHEKSIANLHSTNEMHEKSIANLHSTNEMHEKSIANLHSAAEKLIKEKTTVKVVSAILILSAFATGAVITHFINN